MHQDIEKLINIARNSGELTEKQREIILHRAEKLGEDIDEVEMILETIRLSNKPASFPTADLDKKTRCPNCGALIDGTALHCPECGYTLQKENSASRDVREMVDRLQQALQKASETTTKEMALYPMAPAQRQATVINSFTMPTTKEGLIQLLEFSYSNYISIGNDAAGSRMYPAKKAWYGKAIQAINMLERIGTDDLEIKEMVSSYKKMLRAEKLKPGFYVKFIAIMLAIAVVLILLCR